jgi:hypothetical protein
VDGRDPERPEYLVDTFTKDFLLPSSSRSLASGGQPRTRKNPKEPGFTTQQFENFTRCLHDYYGVEYLNHDFHWDGGVSDSYFWGHTEAARGWIDRRAIGDFTVRTDQHSYDSTHLKYKYDRFALGRGATGNVWGFTDKRHPYVNAIANDADIQLKGAEFFGLWVYEVGNAVSAITGQTVEVPSDAIDRYGVADEQGAAFEDCVFGGRLNADATVTPPK